MIVKRIWPTTKRSKIHQSPLQCIINRYIKSPPKRPPPRYRTFSAIFQYMGPSVRKTGPDEPISYTMIVSGLLNTFLVILDFFYLYHALVTLCKLEKLQLVECVIPTTFETKIARNAKSPRFFNWQNVARP